MRAGWLTPTARVAGDLGFVGQAGRNEQVRVVTVRESLHEVYPAEAESVPRARAAVAAFAGNAGLGPERIGALRLAVSEAVTNAVVHAYRGGPGDVQVSAAVAGEELWIVVTDNGCGYGTPSRTPGLGFGFGLIAEACDEFVIKAGAEGGTEARLVVGLETPEGFAGRTGARFQHSGDDFAQI